MGRINWLGVWTLYKREVWRFLKVWNQTLLAPIVTTLLFLAILNVAMGGGDRAIDGLPYSQFIAPGLIMMAVIQNAFANTSSSLILSKIQGVIIDVLMPPFTAGELTFAYVMGGVTRGVLVGFVVAASVYAFVPFTLHAPGAALLYLALSSMLLSILGLLAGVYAQTFDHIAMVTNFIVTPLSFLSGTFYSIQHLPVLWQQMSHGNPIFHMIDGFRYAVTGYHDSDPAMGLLMLLLLNVLFWSFTQRLIRLGWRLKN